MKEHRTQIVDPTPLTASSPALLRSFDMGANWSDMLQRARARAQALGLQSIPQFSPGQLDELEREVEDDPDPDDLDEDGLIESRHQKYEAIDRRLAMAHVAARVREAREKKEADLKAKADAEQARRVAEAEALLKARSPEPPGK